jgi:hypothetical protein
MAVDASEARLRFLKKAAYQLTTSAPTVSAALSSSYIQSVIGFEDDLQHAKNDWHTVRREACGACGNILLPGWSSSVSHKSRRTTARKRRSKPQTLSEKMIVFTCSRCERRSNMFPRILCAQRSKLRCLSMRTRRADQTKRRSTSRRMQRASKGRSLARAVYKLCSR